MSITAISADFSQNPRTVRIETTDDFEAITAAGYLTGEAETISVLNSGEFEFLANDVCLIAYDGGQQWFNAVEDTLELVADNTVQHMQVDIALAAFIASSTASVQLLPAPGANKKYVLHRATLHVDYGGTALAAGGAVQVQYAVVAAAAGNHRAAYKARTAQAAKLIELLKETN